MSQSFIDAFVEKRIHSYLALGEPLPCSLVALEAKPDGLYGPGIGGDNGLGGGLKTGFIAEEYGLGGGAIEPFSADDIGPPGGFGRPFTPGVIVLGGGGLGEAGFFCGLALPTGFIPRMPEAPGPSPLVPCSAMCKNSRNVI